MRIDKPLSREEAKAGDLIEPGIYPFEVVDAEDTLSKVKYAADGSPLPQKEMIKLKLRIFYPDGRERIIFDYLMEAFKYKLAHFFECIGRWDKYESGDFGADDCYGASGELKIYTQTDKTGVNPDRSAVGDYMLTDAQEAAKENRKVVNSKKQESAQMIDDDLPF